MTLSSLLTLEFQVDPLTMREGASQGIWSQGPDSSSTWDFLNLPGHRAQAETRQDQAGFNGLLAINNVEGRLVRQAFIFGLAREAAILKRLLAWHPGRT